MNYEETVQRVRAYAEATAAAWGRFSGFVPAPESVKVRYVLDAESKKCIVEFKKTLNERKDALMPVLIKGLGGDGERRLSVLVIDEAAMTISAMVPLPIKQNHIIETCLFHVHEYVLRYVACNQPDALGDAIVKTYPAFGLPYGWDETGRVLSLCQTPAP